MGIISFDMVSRKSTPLHLSRFTPSSCGFTDDESAQEGRRARRDFPYARPTRMRNCGEGGSPLTHLSNGLAKCSQAGGERERAPILKGAEHAS